MQPGIDLDDSQQIQRADRHGALLSAAYAGAVLRRTHQLALDASVPVLGAGSARCILIVAGGQLVEIGQVTAALAAPIAHAPVFPVPDLSGSVSWLTAGDAVFVLSAAERDESAEHAAAEARARGCETVVLAPRDSPLSASSRASRVPVIDAPAADLVEIGWAAVSVALRLVGADEERIARMADDLDALAAACGPAVSAVANPAKQCAAVLAQPGALVVYVDGLTAALATHLATSLLLRAGIAAAQADLRTAVAGITRLIEASPPAVDDIFRDPYLDPAEDAPAHQLRLVMLAGGREDEAQRRLTELSAQRGLPSVVLEPECEDPVGRAGQLLLLIQLAAAYASLLADAGSSSAGSSDAESSDAEPSDAESSDPGSPDAGSWDAGSWDAGSWDVGPWDDRDAR